MDKSAIGGNARRYRHAEKIFTTHCIGSSIVIDLVLKLVPRVALGPRLDRQGLSNPI